MIREITFMALAFTIIKCAVYGPAQPRPDQSSPLKWHIYNVLETFSCDVEEDKHNSVMRKKKWKEIQRRPKIKKPHESYRFQ